MRYYILSQNHTRKKDYVLTWWQPNNSGYTYNLSDAGVYDDENHYSKQSGDIMIPCELVDKNSVYVMYYSKLYRIVKNNSNTRKALNILLKNLCDYGQMNFNDHFEPVKAYKERVLKEIEVYKNNIDRIDEILSTTKQ